MAPLFAVWSSRAVLAVLRIGVHLYRATIRRLHGRTCLFHPSCSAFALRELRGDSAKRAVRTVLTRLRICRPPFSIARAGDGQAFLVACDGSRHAQLDLNPEILGSYLPP